MFEIELVKQVEVNVDYILMLVEAWRATRGDGIDTEVEARAAITRAIDSSPSLRNKGDLILAFVDSVTITGDTREDWRAFVAEKRTEELDWIIAEESLKPEATREFVDQAFRDGAIPTAGTAITRILPPVSRFAAGGAHATKKQRVIDRLLAFFDRYFGLA